MKKTFLILLALVLVFSFAACNGDEVKITNAKIDNGVLTWDCNKEGATYILQFFKNDTEVTALKKEITAKTIDLGALNIAAGSYKITISVKNDDKISPVTVNYKSAEKIYSVNLSGNTVTWESNATDKEYTVYALTSANYIAYYENTSEKTFDLTKFVLFNGTYKIAVAFRDAEINTAVSAATDYTVSNGVAVPVISNATISGDTLTWVCDTAASVAYYIEAYNGDEKVGESEKLNVKTFDLAIFYLTEGNYKIVIKIPAANLSHDVTTAYTAPAPVVSNVKISGDTVTWDCTKTAKFVVNVYNGSTKVAYSGMLTEKTFNLSTLTLAPSTYTVKIAIASPATGVETEGTSYSMNAPVISNGKIEGNTLSWECDKSTAYVIEAYSNGSFVTKSVSILTTTYNLTALGLVAGTYTIKITIPSAQVSYEVPTPFVTVGISDVTLVIVNTSTGEIKWTCADQSQTFEIELWNNCGYTGTYYETNTLSVNITKYSDTYVEGYHYAIFVRVYGSKTAPKKGLYFGKCGKMNGACPDGDCQAIDAYSPY